MRHLPIGSASVLALVAATSAAAQAPTQNFNRIASFPVALNLPEGADPPPSPPPRSSRPAATA